MSMKSNSVKDSGAAIRQELCRKSEEIVSQVSFPEHFSIFDSVFIPVMVLKLGLPCLA